MSEAFDYVSAGGCERCDAMEGRYDYEPDRPHDFCQCTITSVAHRDYEWSYSVVRMGMDIPPGGAYEDMYCSEVEVEVTVDCLDGRTFTESLTIEAEPDEDCAAKAAQAAEAHASFMHQNRCIGFV